MVTHVGGDVVGGAGGNADDLTLTLPTHQADDFAVITAKADEAGTVPVLGISTAGWTELFQTNETSGRDRVTAVFYKKLTSSSETDPVFTISIAENRSARLEVFRGVDTSNPWASASPFYAIASGSNDAIPTQVAITTDVDNAAVLIFHNATHNDVTVAGAPSGYTLGQVELPSGNNHGGGMNAYDLDVGSQGVISPGDWTHTASPTNVAEYTVVSIALRPVASGSTETGSVSENVDLAESLSSALTAVASASAPVDFADTHGVVATIIGSVSETAEPADVYSGLLRAIASVSAEVEFAAQQSTIVAVSVASSNPVDLDDVLASIATAVESASSSVDFEDQLAALLDSVGSVSEPVDLDESITGSSTGSSSGSVTESAEFASVLTSVKTAIAAISDAVEFGASWAELATIIADSASPVDFSESLNTGGIVSAVITGQIDLAAQFANLIVSRATASSAVELQTTELAVMTAVASVTELTDYTDVYTRVVQCAESVAEAITLSELIVSAAGEIAAAVRIIVEARDRNITVDPRDRRIIAARRIRRIDAKKLN